VTKGIQSVVLGFRLLQAIVEARAPLSLKAVSALGGMSPSKARMYLVSLIQTGLVSQNADTGLYGLGPYALRLGTRAIQRMDLMSVATDAMQALQRKTGALVLLCAWDTRGIIIVSRAEGGEDQPLLYQIGATASLISTATGLIFLGFGPHEQTRLRLAEELAEAGIPKGERRKRTEALEALAAKARQDRFAEVDPVAYVSGATLTGYAATAAPILDGAGRLRYALTIVYRTGPAQRKQAFARLALETADQVSHLAGS